MKSPTVKQASAKGKKGLTKKLVLSMLAVGALPLLIGLLLAFYQGMQSIREVNGASFEALATETARKLDLVIGEEFSRTALLTTNVHIVKLLEDRRDALSEFSETAIAEVLHNEQESWKSQDSEILDNIVNNNLVETLRQHVGGTYIDPGHPIPITTRSATRALYITDIYGRLAASLDTNIPYVHKQEPWWEGAYHNGVGQPYLSPIAFDAQLGTYTFTLALPIMDSLRYEAIGVLRRIYDAKEFFSPSIDTIRFGKTGHVMLIDSRGVVLSCPILPTGTALSDNRLIPLVTPMHTGWTPAPSDGHGGQDTSIIGFAPLTQASRITQSSTGQAWHMFVWQSSEELFVPIQQFFQWTAAFGLLGVVLLATIGYFVAHRITAPILRIQEAARRIGHGEFQEPVVIKTQDEIQELAEEVNRMNQQLASQFAGLESQVEQKTQEVKYLQESTSQILDSVPDPVIMITPQETIEYVNQASKNALAIQNGDILGMPLFQLLKLDSATQTQLRQEIHELHSQVSLDSVNLESHRGMRAIQDPLAQLRWEDKGGLRQELQLNNRTFRYRWFPVSARPGREAGVGLVLRDTTEESLLQDQLIQSEKQASLGTFSAGIGHELNNPLVGVIGLGEAIQEEGDLTNIKEYARGIVQHGQRMASVVRDFTGQVSREFSETPAPVDINEHLDRVLGSLQSQFTGSPITIQKTLASLPPYQAKPYEISQAFTHVLTNAFQAMKGGGTLEVSTRLQENHIQIVIADSGSGISSTHLPKVFDPFFTTKDQGEGSGLGLTVAHRIITKLGGHIRIESDHGKGTTCTITLPLSSRPSTDRKDHP